MFGCCSVLDLCPFFLTTATGTFLPCDVVIFCYLSDRLLMRSSSKPVMDDVTQTLKPRRIQNQNVVHRLERRRICSGRPGAHWYRVRCFHQNLFPNFTVVNVEKPPCFLRKFSPDGRCFIAFSSDQTSLEVKTGKASSHCYVWILFSQIFILGIILTSYICFGQIKLLFYYFHFVQ